MDQIGSVVDPLYQHRNHRENTVINIKTLMDADLVKVFNPAYRIDLIETPFPKPKGKPKKSAYEGYHFVALQTNTIDVADVGTFNAWRHDNIKHDYHYDINFKTDKLDFWFSDLVDATNFKLRWA